MKIQSGGHATLFSYYNLNTKKREESFFTLAETNVEFFPYPAIVLVMCKFSRKIIEIRHIKSMRNNLAELVNLYEEKYDIFFRLAHNRRKMEHDKSLQDFEFSVRNLQHAKNQTQVAELNKERALVEDYLLKPFFSLL